MPMNKTYLDSMNDQIKRQEIINNTFDTEETKEFITNTYNDI